MNGASRSRKNLFPAHDSIDVSSHLPTQTIAITLLSVRQRVQFPLVVSINLHIQDATFWSSLLLLGDDGVPNIRPHGCNAPHAGRSRRLYDARIIIMRGQRIHLIDARLSRNNALCTYTGVLVNQMAAQVMTVLIVVAARCRDTPQTYLPFSAWHSCAPGEAGYQCLDEDPRDQCQA